MKKIGLITILVVLLGWAVYDTYVPQKDLLSAEESTPAKAEVGIQKGNLAPDFELKTLEGKKIKLSELRGRRVVLNMWATWCPPCRAEMPDMEKFYKKYKDEGVEILAVNMTTSEINSKVIKDFMNEFGITFPVVLDEKGEVGNQFQARVIPTSYLIDSHGVIKQKITGPMSYDWMVKQISAMD